MDTYDLGRRLFLGSAAGAFALGVPIRTQADTAFTEFSFPATGAPTARTMPDRLSDVINVKDWGAVGNNAADDTAPIQAAIDRAISLGGGKVFFPAGSYRCNTPLIVGSNTDVGVQLVGAGKDCTALGFTFISKGANAFDNIERIDGLGAFSTRVTRAGVVITDC